MRTQYESSVYVSENYILLLNFLSYVNYRNIMIVLYRYTELLIQIAGIYLTIRLRTRDFYEMIVDEGEARINYHLVEIASE
jgi:hypothetical protein